MAISDISLTSGMRSNLLSLQNTVTLLDRTQTRLATGKKVNSAIDNATSFFAAQSLNSRASTIDSLKDAMGQAVSTIKAADKGISAITSLIQQAKGIAEQALSAEISSGFDTETVTLNTVVAGNTIQVGGTTLTAGPSGVATTTALTSQTITVTSNNHLEENDTIRVGGITFTAKDATSTAVSTISIDLNTNTLIAGNQITVGGVAYTAVASTSDTVYDSYALNLHNTAVGDQFTVGGATYTAVASVATTTYNHFTVDFSAAVVGDTITIGGHTYTASTGSSATEFDVTAGDKGAAEVKGLIAADEGTNFATSGIAGDAFDITAADGHTLAAIDVSQTGGHITSVADTTVTTNTPGALEFKVGATDALTAQYLKAAIDGHQAGVYSIAQGAGTNGNNLLTFTDGVATLSATSVQITHNDGSATLTDTNHDVDTTVVAADEFVISGLAGADATNLMNAINGLQGSNYTVTQSGSTLYLVGDGSTTLTASTVTATAGRNVVIDHTDTTSSSTLGQFEFGIGADANTTAANLAAKLTAFFGAQLGVANSSGSNVITITAGTTDLSATTVQAGTAAANELTIASVNTVTTADAYAAGYFAVTGNNTTDAATIANLINDTTAITNAHYSATASNGVITISNSEADVAAANVVVTGGTMTEAIVTATSELTDLADQFNTVLTQIDELAEDSGYKGKNLLSHTADSRSLDVKFEGATLNVQGFDATTEGLGVTSSTAGVNTTWTGGTSAINASVDQLDAALTTLRQESSKMSGNLSIITVRQDFSTNMINTLTEGADKLTAADSNEEGANMLMLQTRQSLSTTALSLSAQAAQSVLKLFG